MGQWSVGGIKVTRMVEMETDIAAKVLPNFKKDDAKRVKWLKPHFANDEGEMLLSVHMFVLDTPGGHRIAVDTCIGNDKTGLSFPNWNGLSGPFLGDLENAGFPLNSFTHVLCTHLHMVSHVYLRTVSLS